jgi:amidase
LPLEGPVVTATDERLTSNSAQRIAELVRSRAASAEQVAVAHLARIERLDGVFGAFQAVERELVVADARAVDGDESRRNGPLAGVPVAVKDNFDVAGLPTRHGSAATPDRPAAADDELVRRLRAAGCVVLGKTQMPELAIWPFTEPAAFGVTRNPWSPEHTAGGSSGGSAVAVATRMAALALGSDGGGSIRIPAACCGIFGFKPAPGLVPLPGGSQSHWLGLSAVGPLSRTVGDAALMLDILAGRPPRPEPAAPARLRIAISKRPSVPGSRIDPEVVAAVEGVGRRFREAGHTVTEADPPYPLDGATRFSRRWLPGIAEDAEGLDLAQVEPRTRDMVRAGRFVRRLGLAAPIDRESLGSRMRAWFADRDLLVVPVLASPPVRHHRWTSGWVQTTVGAARWIQTAVWNLAAFPAASVPVTLSKGNLPIAVQLVAPPGAEDAIFAAARQLSDLVKFPAWDETATLTKASSPPGSPPSSRRSAT